MQNIKDKMKKPSAMSVLHIITNLGDGGAEGVLFRLIEYDENDENVNHTVISMMGAGKYGKKLEHINTKVYYLNMSRGKLTCRGIKQLWILLKEEKPDVVQTWMYHADIIGGIIARLAGISKVFWGVRHADLSSMANKKSTLVIMRISAFFSYLIPLKIISCSRVAISNHLKIGYSNKFLYIPNGYNIKTPKSSSKINLEMKDGNLLGMVGRFHLHKDHENLLCALSLLKKKGVNFQCLLVGTNMTSCNTKLSILVNKYNLSSELKLLGQRDDVLGIMETLDLHILSSMGEAFPNVLAEAMSCGTLCVSTDVGDAKDIIGDTGWVVPAKNSDLLANAIEDALYEKNNVPIRWIKRRKAAEERVNKYFNISHIVDLYHNTWSIRDKKKW